MGAYEAIAAAIEAIETVHCVEGLPAHEAAIVATLQKILDQKGCEHFDRSVTSGRLTDLRAHGGPVQPSDFVNIGY